jgi:hypothetical protein
MRCKQVLWTLLFVSAFPLGYWLESLPILGLAFGLLTWVGVYAYQVRQLPRNSILKMRKYLRQGGDRPIHLTVTSEGFTESDDGKSSFASWAQVQSYFFRADVLAIEVAPNLWSVIPANSTSMRNDVQRLLVELARRSVPQGAPAQWRSENAALYLPKEGK